MKELKLKDACTCSKCGNEINVGVIRFIPTNGNQYIKVYCHNCNDYVKIDRYATLIDGAVTVAFAKDNKIFADTYFTDAPQDSEFKLVRSFDTWKEFIEYWDEMSSNPEGMWYYVLDELDGCVVSGAVDPSDREIFEKYLEEENRMYAKNKSTEETKETDKKTTKDRAKERLDKLINESSMISGTSLLAVQILLDAVLAVKETKDDAVGIIRKMDIIMRVGNDLKRSTIDSANEMLKNSRNLEIINIYNMKRLRFLKKVNDDIVNLINNIAKTLGEMSGIDPEEFEILTENYIKTILSDVPEERIVDLNKRSYKTFETMARGVILSYTILATEFENCVVKIYGNIVDSSDEIKNFDTKPETDDEEIDRAMQAEMSESM